MPLSEQYTFRIFLKYFYIYIFLNIYIFIFYIRYTYVYLYIANIFLSFFLLHSVCCKSCFVNNYFIFQHHVKITLQNINFNGVIAVKLKRVLSSISAWKNIFVLFPRFRLATSTKRKLFSDCLVQSPSTHLNFTMNPIGRQWVTQCRDLIANRPLVTEPEVH